MALALERVRLSKNGLEVFHFAPEKAIAEILLREFGAKYVAADFSPEQYNWSKVPVRKVDLSEPLKYLPRAGLNGIVHSHVLEHILGSIDRVITELNDTLAPGGFHLFQVPIHLGWYREDMDPGMPQEVREERFLQHDHLRVFGQEDFADRCLRLFRGMEKVDLAALITREELVNAAVPGNSLTSANGHTAFLFMKSKNKNSAAQMLLQARPTRRP